MTNKIKIPCTDELTMQMMLDLNDKIMQINAIIRQLDKHGKTLDAMKEKDEKSSPAIMDAMDREAKILCEMSETYAKFRVSVARIRELDVEKGQKLARFEELKSAYKKKEKELVERLTEVQAEIKQAKEEVLQCSDDQYKFYEDNYKLHLKQLYKLTREYESLRNNFLVRTGVLLPKVVPSEFLAVDPEKKELPRICAVPQFPIVEKEGPPEVVVY